MKGLRDTQPEPPADPYLHYEAQDCTGVHHGACVQKATVTLEMYGNGGVTYHSAANTGHEVPDRVVY